MRDRKLVCEVCGWRGRYNDVMVDKNPFKDHATVKGCPKCKEVEPFKQACDVAECWDVIAGGTPTKDGYMFLCGKHYFKVAK